MNDFHSVYGTPKSIPSAFKSQVFMYSEINDARLMRDTSDLDKAHVVTSMIFASDLHKPVLDLDFPCILIESETAGHYHLFIDKAISWRHYKRLIKALWKGGLQSKSYYKMTKKQKFTAIRLPGITRENQKMSYKGSKYYTYTDPVTGKKTFFNTAKERDRYAAQQREKRSKR